MTEINLNFMHPKYGTVFNADIDGSFTVDEMIQNLLISGFLPENQAGYELELHKQVFDRYLTFDKIPNLEEGDIIRVVDKNLATAHSDELTVYLKHPIKGIVAELKANPSTTANELLQKVLDRGFIQGDASQYILLTKGRQEFSDAATLASVQIGHQDFIQIMQLGSTSMPPITPMFYALNQRLEKLETNLTQELQLIKDNIPALNTIPIDAKRAINPTEKAYESIDSIVDRLRKDSKQAPLKRIRSINFMPFLLTVAGILLLFAGFFLYLKAITLFY